MAPITEWLLQKHFGFLYNASIIHGLAVLITVVALPWQFFPLILIAGGASAVLLGRWLADKRLEMHPYCEKCGKVFLSEECPHLF